MNTLIVSGSVVLIAIIVTIYFKYQDRQKEKHSTLSNWCNIILLAGGLLAIAEGLLAFFYLFSNVKGIMRKISLRSFSHNVLFIPHAVFFSKKTKNMFYPLLASLLIIEHKGTKIQRFFKRNISIREKQFLPPIPTTLRVRRCVSKSYW